MTPAHCPVVPVGAITTDSYIFDIPAQVLSGNLTEREVLRRAAAEPSPGAPSRDRVRRRDLGPELVIAGCSLFWGSIGLVVREIALPAVTIVTFRVGIAALAIGAWLVLRPDEHGRRLVVHHPLRTLAQGVLLAVHWVCFFAALQRAPVGLVTLLVFLAPLLLAAVAPVVLDEALTVRTVVALGLGLAGTALLVGVGGAGAEPAGIVLALLAAVLLVALYINAKVLSPLYGGRRLALAQTAVAAVVLAPVAVLGDGVAPSTGDLGWLLVLGLLHTAVALALFLGALGRIPALHTGVLSYLEPASATFLGWLVLDEALGLGTVVGGLLVVAGGVVVLGGPGAEELVATPEGAGLSPDREVDDVPG